MSYKKERLESSLREAISQHLQRHSYADGVLVTILGVSVDDRFYKARVIVAVYPDAKRNEVLMELNKQSPKIRYAVMKKSTIGTMPKVVVFE